MEESEKILKQSPWDKASILSKVFFKWVFPLFWKGYHKNLGYEDLYKCPKDDDTKILGHTLGRQWKKQLAAKKPSLLLAIIRAFGAQWAAIIFIGMFEEWFLRVVQPILLGIVVRYFTDNTSVDPLYAYLSAAGVVLCSMIFIIMHHPYIVCCAHIGMKIRIACLSLMYRKILKLNFSSLSKTTVGQIINLMSNDVNRFDEAGMFLGFMFVAPIQTIIIIVILWQYLGIASLVGIVILTFFVPFQAFMGKLFSIVRGKIATSTDERIRLMSEIIGGMKVIKMYAWEKPFAEMVAKVRKSEVGRIRKACMLKAVNLALFFVTSRIVLFACFITYSLLGGHLNAESVFVTVALFNTLRLTLTFMFPQSIATSAESLVSIRRIQDFLLLEEKETSTLSRNILCTETNDSSEGSSVHVENLTAWWYKESEEPCLKNLFVNVKPGELLAVIGSVGSGKSSFLMALLNELSHYKGTLTVNGRVAYAAQEPWSFNDNIRNNIIFGRPFDEERYKRVLHVSALERDLKLFPFGDKTLVGEKGVSLSGGQKARVSLARALYGTADIYLLDDPLSAVDASVANHIFEKCVMGYLKTKIRILVTHQIQFIKKADQILVLNDGKSIAYGTYDELIHSGLDFIKLLKTDKKPKRTDSTEDPQSGRLSRQQSITLSESYEFDSSLTEFEMQPKIEEETKMMGSVEASVYWQYIKSGAGVLFVTIAMLTTILSQALFHSCDFWLTMWTNKEDSIHQQLLRHMNFNESTDTMNTTNSYLISDISVIATGEDPATTDDNQFYILVYLALIISLFITTLIRTSTFFLMCMRASINLHNKIFYKILRSPMAMFDSNPVGRILNRFSRDLGTIDEQLPATAFDLNLTMFNAIGITVVIAVVNPYLIIPAVLLTILVVKLRGIYIRTARDVKRFEGMTRSPVYSHVNTTVTGLTTVRAFGCEDVFQKQFQQFVNEHSGTWFLFLCSNRALGVLMDWICIIYIVVVTIVLMAFPEGMPGGNVGLAMSSALMLTGMFQWGVRQSAEFESQMTAVERVIEYTILPSEQDLESKAEHKPPDNWPQNGTIEYKNVYLTYNNAPKPVLLNLNFVINGGEKIGIVGRTGAGKSSLLSSLFRIREPSGNIIIDGIDIKNLGLHDIRKKISIIPQDPVLFAGTVRNNIDPFNEKQDSELWQALEEVQLKDAIIELNGQLDANLAVGGSNFSVGQRQLICLARALLRHNRILVIDEATANVDHKTDALIQRKIREKFQNCTVLTIAHRLHTIIDSDRVMVLDAGEVLEFDVPYLLLREGSTLFNKMVLQTGVQMYEQLLQQSKQHYFKRFSQSQISIQSSIASNDN